MHQFPRWICCALFTVFALAACMMMSGCESVYERAARLSCQWNHDINLKGCDRWDFARCIEHCEYCVGAPGTQFAGTSDECNQLKCGAYCAAQEADPKCLSTYNLLCGQGKEAYKTHNAPLECDVDCNSAPRAQPQLMAMISIVLLGVSKVPARALLVVGMLVVALHIQGCGDNRYETNRGSSASSSGGRFCDPQTPLIPDWTPDFARMDRRAGCNDHWNVLSGNPCASDVPVIFAKKGIVPSDHEHILEGVEVEQYHCTRVIEGYCAEWTNFEKSCKEEDFGVCTCTLASANKQYCLEWNCITKEAEQNLCWEACCGSESCSPCVQCGVHGSAPFPMNREVFDALMAQDGVISNRTKEDSSNVVGNYLYLTDTQPLLGLFRRSYWGTFSYFGTCIASRDIHSPYEIACNQWREIETEIQNCRCLNADDSDNYCKEWKCEEKDVGQFSILFTGQQSYENILEGQEIEQYTCEKQETTPAGIGKCTGWRGDIESREEVEVAQCRGCEDLSIPHCKSWVCDEYEVPMVLHEDIVWPRRMGYAFLHFLWMGSVAMGCFIFCGAPSAEALTNPAGQCIVGCCLTTGLVLLFYALAFLRWNGDDFYWYAPVAPLGGLFLTFFLGCLAFVVTGLLFQREPGGDQEVAAAGLLACWLCTMLILGLVWVGGLAMLSPVLLCCMCAVFAAACGTTANQKRSVDLSRAEDAAPDDYE